MNKFELLDQHQEAARIAAEASTKERELRKQVIQAFAGETVLEEGTNTYDLPNVGYKLKLKQSYTRKVDEAALTAIADQLPEGTVDKVTRTKIELKVGDYKKLPDDVKFLFDECVITTPGSIAVEIVQPKR